MVYSMVTVVLGCRFPAAGRVDIGSLLMHSLSHIQTLHRYIKFKYIYTYIYIYKAYTMYTYKVIKCRYTFCNFYGDGD